MIEQNSKAKRWGVWLVIAVAVLVLLASVYSLAVPVNDDDFVKQPGLSGPSFL